MLTHANITRTLTTLACTLVLLGCGETLDPASLLNKTRPLGVRFNVEGDAARTRPEPEETLNLTLLMAHAAEELPVSFFAVFCVPEDSTIGVPFCKTDDEGNPVLVGGIRSGNDVLGDPTFQLTIPSDAELDALGVTDQLLMLGAVCQGQLASITGIANLFESDSVNPCREEEDDGAILSTTVTLLRGDAQVNANPGIAGLTLDGEDWDSVPAPTDPATGCMGMGLPEAHPGGEPLVIVLTPAGNAREDYEAVVDDELMEVTESLQVTSLATAGEMQRTFTFIDDDNDTATVEWLPPEEGMFPAGTRVRFEFAARDGRGGLDRVRRQVCLVP